MFPLVGRSLGTAAVVDTQVGPTLFGRRPFSLNQGKRSAAQGPEGKLRVWPKAIFTSLVRPSGEFGLQPKGVLDHEFLGRCPRLR